MMFAEVIGDPVAHSLSPLIHRHWLGLREINADYRSTRVGLKDLPALLEARRSNPDWRGCNVTMPLKRAVVPLLNELDESARALRSVNLIVPKGKRLIGYNSDVDGIAAALDGDTLAGKKAVLIGGGGAAQAAIAYLSRRNVGSITILVRDPAKAAALNLLQSVTALELAAAKEALEGAGLVINASPLGMTGFASMPSGLLDGVRRHCAKAVLFDMVYEPVETAFLSTGRMIGAQTIDGLTMLLGQARTSFSLFFGRAAPASATLRHRLEQRAALKTAAKSAGQEAFQE